MAAGSGAEPQLHQLLVSPGKDNPAVTAPLTAPMGAARRCLHCAAAEKETSPLGERPPRAEGCLQLGTGRGDATGAPPPPCKAALTEVGAMHGDPVPVPCPAPTPAGWARQPASHRLRHPRGATGTGNQAPRRPLPAGLWRREVGSRRLRRAPRPFRGPPGTRGRDVGEAGHRRDGQLSESRGQLAGGGQTAWLGRLRVPAAEMGGSCPHGWRVSEPRFFGPSIYAGLSRAASLPAVPAPTGSP